MLLGALTIKTASLGLLDPRPKPPFLDVNFEGALARMTGIETPKWAENVRGNYVQHYHKCNLASSIDAKLEEIEGQIVGLDFEEMFPEE